MAKPKITNVTPKAKKINRKKMKRMEFDVTGTGIEKDAELIIERRRGKPSDKWSGFLKPQGGGTFNTKDVEIKIGGKRTASGKEGPPRKGVTEVLFFTVQNPDPETGEPDPPSDPFEVELEIVEDA